MKLKPIPLVLVKFPLDFRKCWCCTERKIAKMFNAGGKILHLSKPGHFTKMMR